jgi:hypothetical protein
MSILIFSKMLSEMFLILRRIQWDITKVGIGLHVKYPLFLSDFNETWIFSIDFWKILKNLMLWKSFQLEPSSSMRTDGRIERHGEANSRFSQFFERAYKVIVIFGTIDASKLCNIYKLELRE